MKKGMRKFLLLFLGVCFFTFSRAENNSYEWMNKYFLIDKIMPYDYEIFQKIDLELLPKQYDLIKAEYNKYFPIMLGKARILKDKEEQLKSMVYTSNDSEKIKNLIVDIAKLKTELTVLDINLLKSIQSVLNKKQNEKLIKYLSQGSM